MPAHRRSRHSRATRITHVTSLAFGLTVLGVALGCTSCKGKDGAAGAAGAAASASGAAAAGSAAATGATAPGSTFEGAITMQTSSEHRPPTELTIITKNDKVRLDVPTHNGQTAHSILDSSKKEVIVVVDAQKMAMTMPLPAASAAPSTAPAPAITKTGKHETVAGHDCEDWNVIENSGKHTQLCMADGMSFFDFSAMAPPGSAASQFGSWLTDFKDKQAFPLRAVTTDATGKEESRMEVTKIDAHPVDDALFGVPAGYRSMTMPAMGGMPGMPGMGGPGGGAPPGMGGTRPHR